MPTEIELQFESELESFLQGGLLSHEEVLAWRQRLATPNWTRFVEPRKTVDAATRLLSALLSPFEELGGGTGQPLRDSTASQVDFEDALLALRLSGAISHTTAALYEKRYRQARIGDGGEAHGLPVFAGTELVRTIAGPSPSQRGIVISSIEIYADCVLINCNARQPGALLTAGLADDERGVYVLADCLAVTGVPSQLALLYAGHVASTTRSLIFSIEAVRFIADLSAEVGGAAIT